MPCLDGRERPPRPLRSGLTPACRENPGQTVLLQSSETHRRDPQSPGSRGTHCAPHGCHCILPFSHGSTRHFFFAASSSLLNHQGFPLGVLASLGQANVAVVEASSLHSDSTVEHVDALADLLPVDAAVAESPETAVSLQLLHLHSLCVRTWRNLVSPYDVHRGSWWSFATSGSTRISFAAAGDGDRFFLRLSVHSSPSLSSRTSQSAVSLSTISFSGSRSPTM